MSVRNAGEPHRTGIINVGARDRTPGYHFIFALLDDFGIPFQDFATYGEQFKYMALRPQVPGYAQKSDIIQRHLSEALLQKATPADAMKAAADEVNKATATP